MQPCGVQHVSVKPEDACSVDGALAVASGASAERLRPAIAAKTSFFMKSPSYRKPGETFARPDRNRDSVRHSVQVRRRVQVADDAEVFVYVSFRAARL